VQVKKRNVHGWIMASLFVCVNFLELVVIRKPTYVVIVYKY